MTRTMTGKLILIGCGPGAVDLLTLRAANRIAQADLILFDRLVDADVVALASPSARIQSVGKAPGDGGVQQAGINDAIADALRAGQTVARLKSGDPMVFGRAAEEIAIAATLGAEVEIVPGVTAALAAAADARVGVTERAEVQSFSIVTAKTADDRAPEWADHLHPGACVAFYMGVAQAWSIQSKLLALGAPGHLPAEWIENAGRDCVRTIRTRLDRIALAARENQLKNPAILFVRYPLSMAAEMADAARQTVTPAVSTAH